MKSYTQKGGIKMATKKLVRKVVTLEVETYLNNKKLQQEVRCLVGEYCDFTIDDQPTIRVKQVQVNAVRK